MLASLKARWLRRPATLRSHLFSLVLDALIPLLIFSIAIVLLLAQRERATFQRGLTETTRALATNVDRLLQASTNNLASMATSPRLDAGDVQAFCNLSQRMLQTYPEWKMILLLDPAGAQLCTTIAQGRFLAPGVIERETLETVSRTGKPALSNLFVDKSLGSSVGIYFPVMRANKATFVIVAVLSPQVFIDVFAQQQVAPGWLGLVLDRKHRTIALTPERTASIGQAAAEVLDGARINGKEGWLEKVTRLDGVRSYVAWSTATNSGWSVVVAVPEKEVDELYYRSLWTVGGVGLGFLLLGLLLASIFARRITTHVHALTTLAKALGSGQSIDEPRPSGLIEVDGLAHDLVRAAGLLDERAKERDRVELNLREKELFLQRQADLLDLTAEAIIGWKFGGQIHFWNRGAEKLYGISRAEALGRPSEELLSSLFPEAELIYPTLDEHGEWTGEVRHRARDSQPMIIERHARLVRERNNDRLVLESHRNITQRKQFIQRITTEHAITVILSEASFLEEAIAGLLNAIGTGLEWEVGFFWRVREDGSVIECIETWHTPAREYCGCEVNPPLRRGEGIPGRVWASGEPIWVADVSRNAEGWRVATAQQEGLRGAFAFPIKLHGDVRGAIEFLSTEIREPDPDLMKMVASVGSEIGQFIDRLRAEAALRQSEDNLRRQAEDLERQLIASGRLVAVGELTASMAHEFNNPLGIILGFAQALLADMEPSDPNYHHVEIIVEETQRCGKIVQELLEFGRPKDTAFAATEVKSIVDRTVDLISNRAAKGRVEITADLAPDLPAIRADAQQLQQVLLNLCLNAIDAMPQGGQLTISALQSGVDELTIAVKDTGHGIDADVLPRIFQPFFTAKKRRGLGLGLPICDRIVKAHGGRIEVESQPGVRTIFKICLPVHRP